MGNQNLTFTLHELQRFNSVNLFQTKTLRPPLESCWRWHWKRTRDSCAASNFVTQSVFTKRDLQLPTLWSNAVLAKASRTSSIGTDVFTLSGLHPKRNKIRTVLTWPWSRSKAQEAQEISRVRKKSVTLLSKPYTPSTGSFLSKLGPLDKLKAMEWVKTCPPKATKSSQRTFYLEGFEIIWSGIGRKPLQQAGKFTMSSRQKVTGLSHWHWPQQAQESTSWVPNIRTANKSALQKPKRAVFFYCVWGNIYWKKYTKI